MPTPYEECRLTPADRSRYQQMLDNARTDLLDAVLAVPPAQWRTAPLPGAWSPCEIVEHILLAEASLGRRVHSTLQRMPDSDWSIRTAGIEQRLLDILPKQGKAKAPATLTPSGDLAQTAATDAIAQSSRESSFLLDLCGDLPVKALLAPNAFFGDLSVWHWMLYIPLHTQRHTGQLRRCAES